MRTIFSCVLGALLIAVCCAQTTSLKDPNTDGQFQQAIMYLKLLILQEKDTVIFPHSPTNDIEKCCSESALECFKNQLSLYTSPLKRKLARNLGKSNIQAQCMSCESYPKVSSKDFLINLQSHLQKCTIKALQCSVLELETVRAECFEPQSQSAQYLNRTRDIIKYTLEKINTEQADFKDCFCEKENPEEKTYGDFLINLLTLVEMVYSSF
ncbi:hypothetical protein Baya_4978 [Bagarius yarrelli]|uniref:Interleukin n=1 Tax=Bagarius yarrelli TaxID=175774 RepID=A0A556TRK1_BAGYA|nr:hypothetical protein Baya_4978 [Bagarius yarrelli]